MLRELIHTAGCLFFLFTTAVIIGGLGKLCIAAFDWVFGG